MDIFVNTKRDMVVSAVVLGLFVIVFVLYPDWVMLVGVFLSGLMLAVFVGEYILRCIARYKKDTWQVETCTTQVRLLEAVAKMSVEQLQAVNAQLPVIEIMAGNVGLVKYLSYGEERIPLAWVRQFVDLGQGEYFYPRRRYERETTQRKWADMVTNLMQYLGFAEASEGPYSARWINKAAGMKALGLLEQ